MPVTIPIIDDFFRPHMRTIVDGVIDRTGLKKSSIMGIVTGIAFAPYGPLGQKLRSV